MNIIQEINRLFIKEKIVNNDNNSKCIIKGALSKIEATENEYGQDIYISLGKDIITPSVHTFPIYCNKCNKSQISLFKHMGSRYGYVGSIVCEFCGKKIDIADDDTPVHRIKVDNIWYNFNELYLIDWKYIHGLRDNREKHIIKKLEKYNNKFISLNSFIDIVCDSFEIKEFPIFSYMIKSYLTPLPSDINRWISLLDYIGCIFPNYVKRI